MPTSNQGPHCTLPAGTPLSRQWCARASKPRELREMLARSWQEGSKLQACVGCCIVPLTCARICIADVQPLWGAGACCTQEGCCRGIEHEEVQGKTISGAVEMPLGKSFSNRDQKGPEGSDFRKLSRICPSHLAPMTLAP